MSTWILKETAPGPAPSDQWSERLTMGTGWRRLTVLRETRDQLLLRGGIDGGMQGPYSISQDYFRVDATGQLHPIAGATRPPSTAHPNPAQVQLDPQAASYSSLKREPA